MNSPTANLLGLTRDKVREIMAKNGVKFAEPLSDKAVNQLCALKAAKCVSRSMRKKRAKK